MSNTNITTQSVVNTIIEYGRKHGCAPGDWRLLVASIDDREAETRQLLYNMLVRKEVVQSLYLDASNDPDTLLYAAALKDRGIKFVSR